MKLSVSILLAVDFKRRVQIQTHAHFWLSVFGVLYAGNLIVFITILYFTASKSFWIPLTYSKGFSIGNNLMHAEAVVLHFFVQ